MNIETKIKSKSATKIVLGLMLVGFGLVFAGLISSRITSRVSKCQEIFFGDYALGAVVRSYPEVPSSGTICKHHIDSIAILDAKNSGIKWLEGLEHFKSLTSLSLDGNLIEDLSSLAGLTNLKTLGLSRNNINDIEPLNNLVLLESLDLKHNNVSDISHLERLMRLKNLQLSRNKIRDISSLRYMIVLEELWLDNNFISINPRCPNSSMGIIESLYPLRRSFIEPQAEWSCSDGYDNNNSGRVDCDDPSCFDDPVCM